PESKPILLLVDSLAMASSVTLAKPEFERAAAAFWPGPLTMVLPAVPRVLSSVSAGTGTIGIRWPCAAFALELIRRVGNPITAASANRTGLGTCGTAAEVVSQLGSLLPIIIDGGELPARSGSTLLDLSTDTPGILREGPISSETLNTFFDGKLRR